MSNFDDVNPGVTPIILDQAYQDAEELTESYLALWRKMGVKGSPQQLLNQEDKDGLYDEGFYRGGCVALEVLLGEIVAKRDSIFLEI